MAKLNTSESCGRCAWLLVAPWKVPVAATEVSAGAAICSGALAFGWFFGVFTWYVVTTTEKPWATWLSLGKSALMDFVPCALLPTLVAGTCAGLFFWLGRDKGAYAYLIQVLALSFVPITIPFTAWALMFATITLSNDVVHQSDLARQFFNNSPILLLGSCMWIPLLMALWISLLAWSFSRAKQLAQELRQLCVCECGYDLRGSIAADSTCCPECGQEIPERVRAHPPSLSPDK